MNRMRSVNRLARFMAGVSMSGLAVQAHAGANGPDARVAAFESSLRPAVIVQGSPDVKWTLAERMAHWKVPGLSVAVIRHGQLAWANGYGVRQAGTTAPIDRQTVFSVGSVSKVGTAAITLRLADAGALDIDGSVNAVLKHWHIPDNSYTRLRSVTLRGILSHSAGLNVWGFPDFQPAEPLPTIFDTLNGHAPSKTPPVRVEYVPGTEAHYSGGGVMVEQLVITDVTGLGFDDAARKHLFAPLGMTRSTYENPLPPSYGNVAKAHAGDGTPVALPRGWESMPEMAASGLWTTPADFSKLVIALIASYHGEKNSYLSVARARDMMTEVGPSYVGLGPFLSGRGLARRFFHSGANDSYKAWFEGHLETGDGLVVFANSANARPLIDEVRRAVALAEHWDPAFGGVTHVPRVQVGTEELQKLAGRYEADLGASTTSRRAALALTLAGYGIEGNLVGFGVTCKDGALRLAEVGDAHDILLIPEDGTHFVPVNNAEIDIEFVRGYNGAIESLLIRVNGNVLTAKRAAP